MPNVVFCAPFLLETTVRFVEAAAELPGVRLALVTQEPAASVPESLREKVSLVTHTKDALAADSIAEAVRSVAAKLGPVARLLGADFTVATTGVGGPGPQEDTPQGTVFIAVRAPGGENGREYRFEGEPTDVVTQATEQALRDLASAIGVD